MRTYWQVSIYYAQDVKPPKRPGDLAISVRCYSEGVRDMEIHTAWTRTDVGEVIVTKGQET